MFEREILLSLLRIVVYLYELLFVSYICFRKLSEPPGFLVLFNILLMLLNIFHQEQIVLRHLTAHNVMSLVIRAADNTSL